MVGPRLVGCRFNAEILPCGTARFHQFILSIPAFDGYAVAVVDRYFGVIPHFISQKSTGQIEPRLIIGFGIPVNDRVLIAVLFIIRLALGDFADIPESDVADVRLRHIVTGVIISDNRGGVAGFFFRGVAALLDLFTVNITCVTDGNNVTIIQFGEFNHQLTLFIGMNKGLLRIGQRGWSVCVCLVINCDFICCFERTPHHVGKHQIFSASVRFHHEIIKNLWISARQIGGCFADGGIMQVFFFQCDFLTGFKDQLSTVRVEQAGEHQREFCAH